VTGWLRAIWSRLVAGLAITAVAVVTGVVSYIHIEHLTVELHQPALIAHLMPIGVDGLIVAGSVVLLQPGAGQRWLGWTGVGPGVVISLFANAESAIRFGWLSAAWAAVPAFSFSMATFILERWLAGQARSSVQTAPAGPVLTQVALDAEQAAQNALRATHAAGNPLSGRQLADRFGLNRTQVAQVRDAVLAGSNGHGREVTSKDG
jgi:Protein of unknown function (DUF2637)